jgi:secondary thiamine-phosphate synthase enzyme
VPAGDGVCFLFMPHTTAALTLASLEDEAPGDLTAALQQIVPQIDWRHLPAEHTPGHVLSAMIGASLIVPVQAGRLALGQFQRLVLLEFQGPTTRQINIDFWNRNGEGA